METLYLTTHPDGSLSCDNIGVSKEEWLALLQDS